jgi:glycosyltransferase involved in cell wall biosynthesis
MDKLVIIPTYNERENIVSILQAVLALAGDFHVLVVDDSSPDQTAQLVRELIFTDLGGLLKRNILLFLRWMPISLINQMT